MQKESCTLCQYACISDINLRKLHLSLHEFVANETKVDHFTKKHFEWKLDQTFELENPNKLIKTIFRFDKIC